MSNNYVNRLTGDLAGGDAALFSQMTGYSGTPVTFEDATGAAPTPAPGGLYAAPTRFSAPSSYAGIDPYSYMSDKKKGAQNLNAEITRAQYADYERRFQPIEDMAVGLIKGRNTAALQYDLARTKQSIDSAGTNFQGQQDRAMGRYGLKPAGSVGNTVDLAGAMVGGLNTAKMADEDRALGLLAGTGGARGAGG